MVKNLVIVESPAKSQTIKKFLWEWYEVKASYWHIVDLPEKWMWIDIQNWFLPQYEVSPDKKRVVSELKKLATSAEKVWIATDEDREWEAIWRHVANQLWLPLESTPRIVFHEITKTAIDNAIKNPRTIDLRLVDAQQARRILDRLVWFELSPVLRRKIKTWLSAWRVQSVAVRLIVEREREIQAFESDWAFKIIGNFQNSENKTFTTEYTKSLKKPEDVEKLFNDLKDSDFYISSLEVKPWKKSPSAPFTTSTLQQEASRKLGFSVSRTMQIAQKLYEAGHITYMRTDSVVLSEMWINASKQAIIEQFGAKYSKPTHYTTKTKWSQEAHECIRPTHFENRNAWNDASEKRLYDLIRKRTVASQMAPAVLEKTKATIDVKWTKHQFIATWEIIKFDGFLKLYFESSDDNDDELQKGMLPTLKENENLTSNSFIATEKFKNHPPRYTEASLVKKLEEQEIWRPSTYASIISTIQKRNYVVKEDRPWKKRDYRELKLDMKNWQISFETLNQITWAEKQKLFPTDMWMIVTDFLVQHFPEIMDYWFTASVEQEFDEVAEWNIKWNGMIQKFYDNFHPLIETTLWMERVHSERSIWTDPKNWKPIIARMWRYGPIIQVWSAEDEDKKFAAIPSWYTIETITLEAALKALELPREIWEYEWESITANIWRFGPYIKWDNLFCSIPKDAEYNLFSISLDQAILLIKYKKEKEDNKYINTFTHEKETIQVLNWMYGPYIKYGKKNYKIPKGWKDPSDLTMEDCISIIWDDINSQNKSTTKKSTKTKTTKKKSSKK